MTEQTFWEDESPLIQAIAGEEWKVFRKAAVEAGLTSSDVSHNRAVFSETHPEISEKRFKVTKRMRSVYDEIISTSLSALPASCPGSWDALFVNINRVDERVRTTLNLPNVSPYLRQPKFTHPILNLHLNRGQLGLYGNIRTLLSEVIEPKFVDWFRGRFYSNGFDVTTTPEEVVYSGQTAICDTKGLEQLFLDIKEYYDHLKTR